MAHYRTTVRSTRTTADAFAYLADFTSAVEWDPGTIEAERLDDGEVRVGSRFRLVARFAGRDVPLVYEVLSLDPNERVVLRAENDSIVSIDTITFVPDGAGVEVTYDAEMRLKGPRRLLDPVFQLLFGRVGDAARDGLRRELAATDEADA